MNIAVPKPQNDYESFLSRKIVMAESHGFHVDPGEINPNLKNFVREAIVPWAAEGGRRALFSSFGLHKTSAQLELARLALKETGAVPLQVVPLGVRQEFFEEAALRFTGDHAVKLRFIRHTSEADEHSINLTNYESARDGKIDPKAFGFVSLDEAACLRGFGGTKTFREFMRLFAGDDRSGGIKTDGVRFRYVATATPDPNEFIELLAYAAFLGIMDVGQAKTRFFKRDSEQADKLTIHPHKEREFWLWVASWALFVRKPSDLGYSDDGYVLPALDIRWHEVPSDHKAAGAERDGQARMFKNAAFGVQDAAKEKRESLGARIAKLQEIRAEDPDAHRIIWHDLEAERDAIERAIPDVVSIYGSQALETNEQNALDFKHGRCRELATKPSMSGAGCNFQGHCHWEVFLGIGHKFHDFIQAVHRILRFGQTHAVRLDLIYSEAERDTRRNLEAKWKGHDAQAEIMSAIIREYGLSQVALASTLQRGFGCARQEIEGDNYRLINNDCVDETARMESDSADLIVTSIPFSTQYEYTPSYNDFGHTDNDAHFFGQMDYLTPQLLRVLKPGRIAAIHVKDRIVPGGINGLGFQTVSPFSDDTISHFRKHGFAFLGRKTIVTDVVRENNQTYRLGWTEQCKDGSRMGCGMPEYLLLFRKPPSDLSNGYADNPVVKPKKMWDRTAGGGDKVLRLLSPAEIDVARKELRAAQIELDAVLNEIESLGEEPYDFEWVNAARNRLAKAQHRLGLGSQRKGAWKSPEGYSRARWQVDAHGFQRSSGNRLLSPEDLYGVAPDVVYKTFRKFSLETVYDFERHVAIAEGLESRGSLPPTFMLLPPASWHEDVWTDITRMRTLNGAQHAKGREMHLCLARGSLVLTKAGFKPIEKVLIGDLVLTHRGRWRPVTVVRSTGVQPVVRIIAQGVPGLTVTPDHKLWTRAVRDLPWARCHSKLEATRTNPDWLAAEKTRGSYINLRLPPAETPSDVDQTLWWVVGRWLADGHIDAHGGAIISCGSHEVSSLQTRLGRFGGNPAHGNGSARQILLKDRDKRLRTVLAGCGHGAAGKQLPPEAYVLPDSQAAALLEGYFSGDGHFVTHRDRCTASSVSKALLLGVAILAQRVHGAIASIYPGRKGGPSSIQGRAVATKPEWVLCFDIGGPSRSKRKRPFILDDGAWKKVRQVDPAGVIETWCLRVEEDESFTAEGCVVKNCPLQFDIVDRAIAQFTMPGETVLDPFGGLMTVPYRALQMKRRGVGIELSPGYFRDGAIYCEAAARQMAMPSLFDFEESRTGEPQERAA